MPARDPSLEQQWRDRIERLSRSGLATIKFAQQEGVPVHQVTWWRRELKKRDSAARNETPVARSKLANKKVKQSCSKSAQERAGPRASRPSRLA